MTRAPVIAVCHGGGPLPALGDPSQAELIKSISERVPKILGLGTPKAPRAIILVTAHWSERVPTISNSETHSLYYDYIGMPEEAYRLKYGAPGSPQVAVEVYDVLAKAGFTPRADAKRGWDHGVFVPMMLINPKADVPIVQLSILASASPSQHFAMGRALSSLRDSGIAIIGSGMPSFHNLRILFSSAINDDGVKARNKEWSNRLLRTVQTWDSEERGKKFDSWRDWIGSKEAHPVGGVEHFLPLVVCAGAGGDGKAEFFVDNIMSTKQYSYYWAETSV
ncbi:Extradiol ring-cleavage dioxygenase, class III enzyme, subunit B [Leptodontidium sp. MPI-SDFR-AT-0119]|nr:Extradiol ring-cleavage dioxygenase, class III enzyme, subunit B [Leptodontidium sp. MPI-SDFR-AT-0119]